MVWRRQLDSISGVGEGMRCNNRSSIASGSLVAELAVETLSSSYFANPGADPGYRDAYCHQIVVEGGLPNRVRRFQLLRCGDRVLCLRTAGCSGGQGDVGDDWVWFVLVRASDGGQEAG
jgi:hypothetical protein